MEIEGVCYGVRLAPVERPKHVSSVTPMQAVCFETENGRWIGSAVIRCHCELRDMSETELAALLRQETLGRGGIA